MRVLERDPKESGRNYALRTIKENIIHAELPPGALISESELASQLGLSRTPVREALIELSRCGVVEIAPQKRGRVALIDWALVEEARFSRNVLECAVAAQCCEAAGAGDLARLTENVAHQERCAAGERFDAIMELDDGFHEMLFEITGKSHIFSLIKNMSIHFDRVRFMALQGVPDLEIVADHRKILDAICARDAVMAHRLMQQHLDRCGVDAMEIRSRFPQYFKSE